MAYNHALKHEVEDVDKDDKGEKYANANKVNGVFHLAIYRLSAYPLDDREENVRAVQRRKWQQVKYGKVRRDKRYENEDICRIDCRVLCHGGNCGDCSTHFGDWNLKGDKQPQTFYLYLRKAERHGKCPPKPLEKAVLIRLGANKILGAFKTHEVVICCCHLAGVAVCDLNFLLNNLHIA